jgi:hypothetical protein
MDRHTESPTRRGAVDEAVFRPLDWELRRAERFGDPFALVYLQADPPARRARSCSVTMRRRLAARRVRRKLVAAPGPRPPTCSVTSPSACASGVAHRPQTAAIALAAVAYPEDGRTIGRSGPPRGRRWTSPGERQPGHFGPSAFVRPRPGDGSSSSTTTCRTGSCCGSTCHRTATAWSRRRAVHGRSSWCGSRTSTSCCSTS